MSTIRGALSAAGFLDSSVAGLSCSGGWSGTYPEAVSCIPVNITETGEKLEDLKENKALIGQRMNNFQTRMHFAGKWRDPIRLLNSRQGARSTIRPKSKQIGDLIKLPGR